MSRETCKIVSLKTCLSPASLELSETSEKGGGPADRGAYPDQPALSSASPRYKSKVVPMNGDSGGLILMIISRCRDRKANNNTL